LVQERHRLSSFWRLHNLDLGWDHGLESAASLPFICVGVLVFISGGIARPDERYDVRGRRRCREPALRFVAASKLHVTLFRNMRGERLPRVLLDFIQEKEVTVTLDLILLINLGFVSVPVFENLKT
jgi:hypothetical protein